MSSASPLWGAPRIVGELGKIRIEVAKSTVEKQMVRRRKPPSRTWRAFLKNRIREIVAVDFFVVPTVRQPSTPRHAGRDAGRLRTRVISSEARGPVPPFGGSVPALVSFVAIAGAKPGAETGSPR
jgi:hypothetical protein